MNRGEVWLARVGGKRRPVLILTRTEVIDVRALETVAEITTSVRRLAAEVPIDADEVGLDHESVVNCDGLHTVPQAILSELVGTVGATTMHRVCAAVGYAVGC